MGEQTLAYESNIKKRKKKEKKKEKNRVPSPSPNIPKASPSFQLGRRDSNIDIHFDIALGFILGIAKDIDLGTDKDIALDIAKDIALDITLDGLGGRKKAQEEPTSAELCERK